MYIYEDSKLFDAIKYTECDLRDKYNLNNYADFYIHIATGNKYILYFVFRKNLYHQTIESVMDDFIDALKYKGYLYKADPETYISQGISKECFKICYRVFPCNFD